jgi:hypothetical protein
MDCLKIDQLRQVLLDAKGLDRVSLLSDEMAHARAEAILDEIARLEFELHLLAWPSLNESHYPAYKISDPRYDLNSFEFGAKDAFAVNGPGISHGDLLKLGRAFEMKQKFLPVTWPKELRDHLLDHQSHLDTVEELCWLDRWHNVQNVTTANINPNTGKDTDWKLTTCGIPLGIDVKNRRKEWTGILDGTHKSRNYDSWFDDFIGKFYRSAENALNLACISTFLTADDDLKQQAETFLATNREIDGIVVYSSHAGTSFSQITVFAADKTKIQVNALLKPLAREDLEKVIRFQHLARNKHGGVINSIDDYLEA